MPTKDNNNQYVTKTDLKNELKKFATKEDLKNELKKFATKDDLKNELKKYATKDDLKRFATKDDLKRFATKDDLKKFATKDDFDMVAGEIVTLHKRIDSVETNLSTRMDRLEGIVQKVLNVVDGIAKKFDDYKTEKAATERTFQRHENQLADHEKRIKTLEEERN